MPSLSKGGNITELCAGMHFWLGSQFAGHFIDQGRTLCQGHSHPKLLVALGIGSKLSADKIQPTAHKPTGYGQYSGVVPVRATLDPKAPTVRLYTVQVSCTRPLNTTARIAKLSPFERGINSKDNTHLNPQRGLGVISQLWQWRDRHKIVPDSTTD